MRICIVIPVYNHHHAIEQLIKQLQVFKLTCFLVNDGSSNECSQVLKKIANQHSRWLSCYERHENGGKGAAVIDGFQLAYQQGFSHAIQIDADGQHAVEDISRFVEACQHNPEKMILGQPCFDQSVPKKRLYGRYITNLWIWINTLSFAIKDGMCGYRCYPLAAVDQLLDSVRLGQGMDFDIDIVVRLYWQGLEVINIPTQVKYPIEGISHFNMLQDNLLISKKHAQLFFGMLLRAPKLLLRAFS
jgi:glycosyltransferase involved in cell wall biosynthesis